MTEHQNIEYKQSWHDDYLKWVCGFANAQGGVIFIGKDDNGNIVGIDGYKKLMDDIPNKIKNAIGIMVEVNLHELNGKHFIEIVIHPYSVPISL
ncbi:MAG: ATP-binding protein, partial [Bacteroidetes bacterium]|nr:ATP-binding protein [Bacteroidota bacterium]